MTRWTNEEIKQRHGFSRRHSLLCAVACATLFAHAATVYVAPEPTGSDETGDGSQANPYATAAKALSKVTQYTDYIYFDSGTYYFTEAAAIGNKNVRIIGKDDRSVIFDGQGQTRILVANSGGSVHEGIVIQGITFRNGRYSDSNDGYGGMKTLGGAVRLTGASASGEGATLSSVVTNCAFVNCSSAYGGGGALYVCSGSTVVDCSFENCTAGLDGVRTNDKQNSPGGGAIHANTDKANVEIIRCSFTGNVCSNGVGAVGAGGSTLDISTNAYSVIVRNCGFTNNVSYGYSACLGLKARMVENCTFKGNESRKSGTAQSSGVPRNCGGVFAPEAANKNLTIPQTVRYSGCRFEDNASLAGGSTGGGVFHVGGMVLVSATNCVFVGNSSAAFGNVYFGAPSAGGGLVMDDCVVAGNWSRAEGTSIFNRFGTIFAGESSSYKDATLRLRRTLFAGNVDHGAAGLIWTPSIGTEIVDCEFRGNLAKNAGVSPATVNFMDTATNSLVRGCLFAANTNNSASASVVRFSNYNADGNGTGSIIESCTFAGNRTTGVVDQYTGAICLRSSDAEGFAIRNCVFWDNRSTNENASVRSFASTKSDITKKAASYCWEDGAQLVTGTNGNIAGGTTPGFVDAANGDYAPTKQSPFRDKGILQAWMSNARDLAKNVRVLGDAPDMGCYEFVPGVGGLSIFVR